MDTFDIMYKDIKGKIKIKGYKFEKGALKFIALLESKNLKYVGINFTIINN